MPLYPHTLRGVNRACGLTDIEVLCRLDGARAAVAALERWETIVRACVLHLGTCVVAVFAVVVVCCGGVLWPTALATL